MPSAAPSGSLSMEPHLEHCGPPSCLSPSAPWSSARRSQHLDLTEPRSVVDRDELLGSAVSVTTVSCQLSESDPVYLIHPRLMIPSLQESTVLVR